MYSLELGRTVTRYRAATANRSRPLSRPAVNPVSPSSQATLRALNRPVKVASNALLNRPLSSCYELKTRKQAFGSQIRWYSTPTPVEEVTKEVTEKFVASAVAPIAPQVEPMGALGVNEGFARFADPLSWTGFWDPIFYLIQGNFELVHTLSGLEWWSALIAVAAVTRVLCFPMQVQQMKQTAIMQALQPELAALRAKYMYAQSGSAQEQMDTMKQMRDETNALLASKKVGLFSSLKYTLPQAFVMISGFFVIRSISNDPTAFLHSFFANGGTAWFQNITLADPTFLLPAFSSISTAALIAVTPMPQYSRRTVLLIAAALAALSFSFTNSFPAAVHLFWAGSSIFTLLSTALLRNDTVRKFFGILPMDPAAAAAAAPKPILFDAPPKRSKLERVAATPSSYSGSLSSKKKTKK